MGNADKRARQRANREARRERERKEERRKQVLVFARRAAIALVFVLGAGILISTVFGGNDEPADTTAPFDTTDTTDTTDTSTTDPEATTTLATVTTTTAPPDAVDGDLSPEYQAFQALPTACGAPAPEPVTPMEFSTPEDQGLAPDDTVVVTMETSCGTIVMELDPSLAPESVNSFVFLARQGFFEGIVSHRIVPGFVVQAGDPTATGRGGPGYDIRDEFPEEGFAYDRGVVAMAKTQAPNTTGSQFFIAFAETGLDNTFNALGKVVEGLEVLDAIEAIPTDPAAQRPLEALYIESVTVEVR